MGEEQHQEDLQEGAEPVHEHAEQQRLGRDRGTPPGGDRTESTGLFGGLVGFDFFAHREHPRSGQRDDIWDRTLPRGSLSAQG
jgi:hypothetical protein